MIVVPALMPVTRPVEAPIVAMPVLPDIHVPPAVASPSSDVAPMQALRVPVIGAGSGSTVMVVVTAQPVGSA